MVLTPEDVHKKTFTPVRLREGYDMAEVDHFLDEVEAELTRLQQENEDLRTKSPSAATETVETGEEAATQPATVPPLPAVSTVPEASSAAVRLLEIATSNADQLVTEATGNADRIVTEARTRAEQLEAEARSRAENLDTATDAHRQEALGQLQEDKKTLADELENLRAFEREYRSRLRAYFQAQLETLDGQNGRQVPTSPGLDGDAATQPGQPLGDERSSESTSS